MFSFYTRLLLIILALGLCGLVAAQAPVQDKKLMAKNDTTAFRNNGDDIDVEALKKEIAALQIDGEDEPEETKQFPKKNPQLMAQVKTLDTQQELIAYVGGLEKLVASKMSAGAVKKVKQMIDSCDGNTDVMEAAAVAAWYNQSYKEALLIATEASLKRPGDHLLLNNLAALLNLSGSEYKALPLLKMLVRHHPRNGMVLNNIGQAFTGVGELDSAMGYFARCIEEVPNHPEANHTAGEIEASRGNHEKAEAHFQQSLNGGITDGCLKRLEQMAKTKPNYGNYISRYVRPRVKLPDIFNAYKYKPVSQIRNVEEAKTLTEEHMQFEDFLHNVLEMYGNLMQEEEEKGHALHEKNVQLVSRNPLAYMENIGRYFSPFASPAGNIYTRLFDSYRLRREDMARYRKEREQVIDELQLEMGEQMARNSREDYTKCLAATNCKNCNPEEICNRTVLHPLNNKAANEFLAKAADIREEIQRKELALTKETYENLAYFGYLAGPNKHLAKANFYKACYDYAAAILQANETAFVAKAGEEGEPFNPKPGGSDAPADINCPINIKVEWGVAKLELSCEKFKISAFGGMLKGSGNAKTKQSTLQIGAELSQDFKKKIGNEEAVIKVGMEESFYITFDEYGSLVDGGLAFEAKAAAALSSTIATGSEQIKNVDPGIKGEQTIFGYTLGVNSGWTFKEGLLTAVIDPIIMSL